jgi:peptidylprolyl isomerase
MRKLLVLALAAASPALAQDAPEPVTPSSLIASAPAADWQEIDPADLLVMTLAPDRDGNSRQVVIQLMPAPFSQGWVGNIRTLAKAHWWDGTSINRVQDNYVVQWGDVTEKKPLPGGLRVVPESEYETTDARFTSPTLGAHFVLNPQATSPAVINGRPVLREVVPEWYATFYAGFPVAGYENPHHGIAWPVHCYASVGVGRNLSPDTGTGAELYAVIGHAPRQLDRNIAVVGRVIEGIEHLSSLPRGKAELGFYGDDQADQRVPIVAVRLGDELPAAEQPRFEYLASDSASFAEYVRVRANRKDTFYNVPAGGVDVCNVQVPVRRIAQ